MVHYHPKWNIYFCFKCILGGSLSYRNGRSIDSFGPSYVNVSQIIFWSNINLAVLLCDFKLWSSPSFEQLPIYNTISTNALFVHNSPSKTLLVPYDPFYLWAESNLNNPMQITQIKIKKCWVLTPYWPLYILKTAYNIKQF